MKAKRCRREGFAAMAAMSLLGVSGCDETAAVRGWIATLEPLRVKAAAEIHAVPYQTAQHLAFKNYFHEIETTALKLVQDRKFAEKFNQAVAKTDLKDTCARVFMERRDWESIAANCLRNGLFICSEEVRVYPEMVAGIRKKLIPDQQRRFDAAPSCQAAL